MGTCPPGHAEEDNGPQQVQGTCSLSSSQGTARAWIHRQGRDVALNALSGVAGSVVLEGLESLHWVVSTTT